MGQDSRRRGFERLRELADGPYVAQAIEFARKFLERFPDHAAGWTRLGMSLTAVARYQEAELANASALLNCAKEYRYLVLSQLGHAARSAGNCTEAASWYRKAIAAAPDNAGNYIFLGAVLAKQGRFAEAESAHRAATQCPEGCIDEAYLNLGLIFRAQERFEESAECFREAIRRDPDYCVAKEALLDVKRVLIARRRKS